MEMNFGGTWCTVDLHRAYSQHDPQHHINNSCPSPFVLLTIPYPPEIQARTAAQWMKVPCTIYCLFYIHGNQDLWNIDVRQPRSALTLI